MKTSANEPRKAIVIVAMSDPAARALHTSHLRERGETTLGTDTGERLKALLDKHHVHTVLLADEGTFMGALADFRKNHQYQAVRFAVVTGMDREHAVYSMGAALVLEGQPPAETCSAIAL